MRVVSAAQHTAEWMDARRGKPTASRLKDIMSTLRDGVSKGEPYQKYCREMAMERLTGLTATHYVTPAMEHGTAYEPIARASYELERDVMVDTVGLVLHPTIDYFAASPDGLVGSDGAIEIKAPQENTHIGWLEAGAVVPKDHQWQCLGVMLCCERDWIDFISGHPRFKLFVVRMHRDEKRIKQIEAEVKRFEEDVQATMERLRPWVIPAAPVDTRSEWDQLMDVMDRVEAIP